jgi:adenosine deaminase
MNEKFETFLQNHNLSGISSINKSDLHNHLGKGGNINYITSKFNLKIDSPPSTFKSIFHMDEWVKENIKKHCPYIKRLEAAFVQAADDNISVLAVWM